MYVFVYILCILYIYIYVYIYIYFSWWCWKECIDNSTHSKPVSQIVIIYNSISYVH